MTTYKETIEALVIHILEDCPKEYMSRHLLDAIDAAQELLTKEEPTK